MRPDEGAAGATHTGKAPQTNASARQRRTAARGALRTNCGNAGKTADRLTFRRSLKAFAHNFPGAVGNRVRVRVVLAGR